MVGVTRAVTDMRAGEVTVEYGHRSDALQINHERIEDYGERGGTRTLDPMIKSHVLYHLSYALPRGGV